MGLFVGTDLKLCCRSGGRREATHFGRPGALKWGVTKSPYLKVNSWREPDYQPPRKRSVTQRVRGPRTLPSTPRARSLADRLPVPTLLRPKGVPFGTPCGCCEQRPPGAATPLSTPSLRKSTAGLGSSFRSKGRAERRVFDK